MNKIAIVLLGHLGTKWLLGENYRFMGLHRSACSLRIWIKYIFKSDPSSSFLMIPMNKCWIISTQIRIQKKSLIVFGQNLVISGHSGTGASSGRISAATLLARKPICQCWWRKWAFGCKLSRSLESLVPTPMPFFLGL